VTVGEQGQGWSGVATIGNMTEWPSCTPTEGEQKRLGPLPRFVPGGSQNPMGARAMYLFANGKDTLYRIHGTNQPEYIGAAISSGCIRLTNEDIIDLYNRVKVGTTVIVLGPGQGDWPFSLTSALNRTQVRSPSFGKAPFIRHVGAFSLLARQDQHHSAINRVSSAARTGVASIIGAPRVLGKQADLSLPELIKSLRVV
jgi:hypothetical protein